MTKCKPLPPKEVLDRWFRLDVETGRLFWKEKPCQRIHADAEAGSCGYFGSSLRWTIAVPGYPGRYYRYRVIWKMVYGTEPSDAIDHWDRNTLNDAPANLLNGGQSWNGRNKVITSQSGYRGVMERKNKNGSTWWATMHSYGRTIYLGTYATPEEAAAAYEKARMERKPDHTATV